MDDFLNDLNKVTLPKTELNRIYANINEDLASKRALNENPRATNYDPNLYMKMSGYGVSYDQSVQSSVHGDINSSNVSYGSMPGYQFNTSTSYIDPQSYSSAAVQMTPQHVMYDYNGTAVHSHTGQQQMTQYSPQKYSGNQYSRNVYPQQFSNNQRMQTGYSQSNFVDSKDIKPQPAVHNQSTAVYNTPTYAKHEQRTPVAQPEPPQKQSATSTETVLGKINKIASFFTQLVALTQAKRTRDVSLQTKAIIHCVITGSISVDDFIVLVSSVTNCTPPQPGMVAFIKESFPLFRQSPSAVLILESTFDALNEVLSRGLLGGLIKPDENQSSSYVVQGSTENLRSVQTYDSNTYNEVDKSQTSKTITDIVSSGAKTIKKRPGRKKKVRHEADSSDVMMAYSESKSFVQEYKVDYCFFDPAKIRNAITPLLVKYNLNANSEDLDSVLTILSHALEHRVRKVLTEACHFVNKRLKSISYNNMDKKLYDISNTATVFHFMEDVLHNKLKAEASQEQEKLIALAKSKTRGAESSEHAAMKEKAKILLKEQEIAMEANMTNLTALAAIGERRKRSNNLSYQGKSSTVTQSLLQLTQSSDIFENVQQMRKTRNKKTCQNKILCSDIQEIFLKEKYAYQQKIIFKYFNFS